VPRFRAALPPQRVQRSRPTSLNEIEEGERFLGAAREHLAEQSSRDSS
jgi:hypothetical protein